MSEERQMTVDCLSIRLVDRTGLEIEEADSLVDEVLTELRRIGWDLLASLDPPTGIRVWLEAKGLSLVATHEPPPVKAWDRLVEDEPELPAVGAWVGAAVRYSTAPSGPRQEITIGTGVVTAMRQSDRGVMVTVKVAGRGLVHLIPADGDLIEALGGQGDMVSGP